MTCFDDYNDGKWGLHGMDWVYFSTYIVINAPLWYAPFPFVMYVLRKWADTYKTRYHLRRVCFWINFKQFAGLAFLIWMYQVSKLTHGEFWLKMTGQLIFFCIYIYLQGLLNNFAYEKKDEVQVNVQLIEK